MFSSSLCQENADFSTIHPSNFRPDSNIIYIGEIIPELKQKHRPKIMSLMGKWANIP